MTMKARLHAGAGALALLLVITFLTSTLVSEFLLDEAAVASVKAGIVYAMTLLIAAMAATGGSGFSLARGRAGPILDAKKLRMKIIAANGAMVMLPCALVLNYWASHGAFDWKFYSLQGLELTGSALQLTLLGLNVRDGLRLNARKRQIAKARA